MAEPSVSLVSRVSPIEAGAYVTAATFLGGTPVLALGDGSVVLLGEAGSRRVIVHEGGAILVAAQAGGRLVTGGDDGRVMAIDAQANCELIVDENGKWIDALALRDDFSIAWSSGKEVRARDPKGKVKGFAAPSSVRGLAFAPKGYRLAIAHYNGATLWFPNAAAKPELFEWKGAHLDVTMSPDGRFLVTSMQENSLHGWRVTDKRNMRMTGYPAKTRSYSWSPDGHWLATSGAEACIIWPFRDKDGPMGKAPRECGVRQAKVSRVAFHPKALVIAIGYEDGWILLCRLEDGAEILIRGQQEGAEDAISALVWSPDGRRLLFGTAEGRAGLLAMPE
ncbi:MAG: WD40 repeat domain-containing protein [Beijerinckiaceae bacterium]